MAEFGDNPLADFTMVQLIDEIRERCDLYALSYRLKSHHNDHTAGNYSHKGGVIDLLGMIELHKMIIWKDDYLDGD